MLLVHLHSNKNQQLLREDRIRDIHNLLSLRVINGVIESEYKPVFGQIAYWIFVMSLVDFCPSHHTITHAYTYYKLLSAGTYFFLLHLHFLLIIHFRYNKFVCPHCNVFVLFAVGIGTTYAEIPLVEETHHQYANGKHIQFHLIVFLLCQDVNALKSMQATPLRTNVLEIDHWYFFSIHNHLASILYGILT